MIPMGDGRYCGSCQKVVVDFTRMTDAEVKSWFGSRKQEKVCGRLNQRQLSDSGGMKKRFYQFSKVAAAAGLLLSSVACESIMGSETLGDIALPADSLNQAPSDTSARSETGAIIQTDSLGH